MIDNEIINALECCTQDGSSCRECCFDKENECIGLLSRNALDLINRQKAEIDSLNEQERILIYQLAFEREKAIKEFAERLKKDFKKSYFCNSKYVVVQINNLAKEMTEESDGKL